MALIRVTKVYIVGNGIAEEEWDIPCSMRDILDDEDISGAGLTKLGFEYCDCGGIMHSNSDGSVAQADSCEKCDNVLCEHCSYTCYECGEILCWDCAINDSGYAYCEDCRKKNKEEEKCVFPYQ